MTAMVDIHEGFDFASIALLNEKEKKSQGIQIENGFKDYFSRQKAEKS